MSPLATWLILGGLAWLATVLILAGVIGFGTRWVDEDEPAEPPTHGTVTTDDGWFFTPTGNCTCIKPGGSS